MQKIQTIDSWFYRALGKQIRHEREFRNMTQLELSKATGYSRSLIDHWELGYNKIKPKQYEMLCKALSIPNSIEIDIRIGHRSARYD